MKLKLIAAALAMFSCAAVAQVNNAQFGGANAAAASQSGALAGSTSGAGAAAVIEQNFNTPSLVETRQSGGTTLRQDMNYSGKYEVKNVPHVIAPNILPTSPCMGSSSLGVGVSGFGIGGGTSWKDEDCGYRETARVFLQAGMAADGIAVLCASPYAASAPACKAAKKAEAEQTMASAARDEMVRTMNDRARQQQPMTKSQLDREVTTIAMMPKSEQQAANCDLARRTQDQILANRFGCPKP